MNMELLAISAGLELMDTLDLHGTVFSDCQGLVKKLLHPHVLRRTPTSASLPLICAYARRLQHPSRTLQWVRGHSERSRTPRTAWDQSQWGIFLAPGPRPPLLCWVSFFKYPSNILQRVLSDQTTGIGLQRATLPSSVPWGAR